MYEMVERIIKIMENKEYEIVLDKLNDYVK